MQHSPAVNRFGFFGQFIDNKGVDVILEALLILARDKRIPSTGIMVEINAGNKHYASPAYIEKISQYVEMLKKVPTSLIQVRERGPYDREQLEERMLSVDWVLVPSTWWEIYGLVVSEAWMFGRPVIASAIAALKDRVQDGVNGFTFPARNAQALADLMVSLIGDEQQWQSVSASIAPIWNDVDMLNGYLSIWQEFKDKRDGVLEAAGAALPDAPPAEPASPAAAILAADEPGTDAPSTDAPKPAAKKKSTRKARATA
jgi:glycosyltransferase involved in cell wall biosynthesis